jgi:outer membrane protein assembly factor BamD
MSEKRTISGCHCLSKITIISLFILSLFCICTFSGCAGHNPGREKTAEQLFKEGSEQFSSGRHKNAIESFNNLRDWYPFSKYAIQAELKTADAYFNMYELTDAIFAYDEFERLHPTNENIPYILHQIGICYLKQIDAIDRDQTPAERAIEYLQRLMREYPDTQYVIDARESVLRCYKSVIGHELYIGQFYLKSKLYESASNRFQGILTDYPNVGLHQTALSFLSLCQKQIDRTKAEKASSITK